VQLVAEAEAFEDRLELERAHLVGERIT